MPINYHWSARGDEGVTPVIVCDTCGVRITEARYANVLWERLPLPSGPESVSKTSKLFFAHKGECDEVLTRKLVGQGIDIAFGELALFPLRLLGGLGYPELALQAETLMMEQHRQRREGDAAPPEAERDEGEE